MGQQKPHEEPKKTTPRVGVQNKPKPNNDANRKSSPSCILACTASFGLFLTSLSCLAHSYKSQCTGRHNARQDLDEESPPDPMLVQEDSEQYSTFSADDDQFIDEFSWFCGAVHMTGTVFLTTVLAWVLHRFLSSSSESLLTRTTSPSSSSSPPREEEDTKKTAVSSSSSTQQPDLEDEDLMSKTEQKQQVQRISHNVQQSEQPVSGSTTGQVGIYEKPNKNDNNDSTIDAAREEAEKELQQSTKTSKTTKELALTNDSRNISKAKSDEKDSGTKEDSTNDDEDDDEDYVVISGYAEEAAKELEYKKRATAAAVAVAANEEKEEAEKKP